MPDNVRAVPLNTHSIRLTWSIRMPQLSSSSSSSTATLSTDIGSGSDIEIIDGFYIGYKIIGGGNDAANQAISSSSSSSSLSSSSTSSYTYKTISNVPMQPLFTKIIPSQSSWKSGLFNSKTNRAKPNNVSLSMKMNNQSMSIDSNDPSNNDLMTMTMFSSPFHQYYEHVIDVLQRQTQYQ